MKAKPGCQQGNALIVVIVALIVLGGASAAILSICVARSREAVMAHENARAFYAAEAGVGASIAEITADQDYDSDGKGNVTDNFDNGSYSVTATDDGSNVWTITSTGTYNSYSRRIEVVIGRRTISPFMKAAFGGTGLSITGTSFCDGYDSDSGSYDSQAVNTDPNTGTTYANDSGSLGSNGDIDDAGGEVYGDVTPGPGQSVTGGGTYITGSTAPAEEPTDIGTYEYTPEGSSLGPLTITTSMTLPAGTYRYDHLITSSQAVLTLGEQAGDEVTLYVDGVISITGQSRIVVYSGAKAVIHHGGLDTGKELIAAEEGIPVADVPDIYVAGGGIVNTNQLPADLMIYSAATDPIELKGGSEFHGVVYAPAATVEFSGTAGAYGSLVGNLVTISGTGDLHYDEALADIQIVNDYAYEAKSWREF